MTKRKNKSTIAEVPSRYRYGIKALTAFGTTESSIHGSTSYILPRPDQKWGDVMQHPTPAEFDGEDCGAGRYHVWKKLTKEYAPKAQWFWLVRYKPEDIVGESSEKVSVRSLQLRRINEAQLYKLIRRGWATGADLTGANLRGADLTDADLRGADLTGADLTDAHLRGANLRGANLTDAHLRGANLRGANLRGADLTGADLRGADLTGANLKLCRYNPSTIFPEAFDPELSEMVKAER